MKKKIFSLILGFGLVLLITGCGNEKSFNNEALDNNIESNNEQSDGEKTITCKSKSNDFATIVDNIKSATRIETYVVFENKVTDYSVDIEVVLDENEYSKEKVNDLVNSLNIPNHQISKKSDYVLNFKQADSIRWFDNQEYDDITKAITESVELRGYKCTMK